MSLPIVEVPNGKAQARVFDKSLNPLMAINKISGRLLPFYGVSHNKVEMAFYRFTHFTGGKKANICCGARFSILFKNWNFRNLP